MYLTERLEDGKTFAVKALSKKAVYLQENGKETLQNEIALMRKIDHSCVVKLHEVYETEQSLYFVLDLLGGGNLNSIIK